ncbi:MAG: bifunctional nuclease family protein [bacterium]
MIQVTVAGMILDQNTRGPVLLLHLPPLDKYLPVWIGPSEAASISMALQKERFERPLTHDLLATIIDGLDGKVAKITITELRENTFYAKIFIERGQQMIGIDARPSDSIAIAIRTEAPIFVAEAVVDQERDHLLSLDENLTSQIIDRHTGGPTDHFADLDPAASEKTEPAESDSDGASEGVDHASETDPEPPADPENEGDERE